MLQQEQAKDEGDVEVDEHAEIIRKMKKRFWISFCIMPFFVIFAFTFIKAQLEHHWPVTSGVVVAPEESFGFKDKEIPEDALLYQYAVMDKKYEHLQVPNRVEKWLGLACGSDPRYQKPGTVIRVSFHSHHPAMSVVSPPPFWTPSISWHHHPRLGAVIPTGRKKKALEDMKTLEDMKKRLEEMNE
eukprot:TRINITY_DN1503_c0_g1_i3.p2 TRINITY_DN1503_c0_g1~~TRINITY_DN1503_c0_g1_i3.p2  ORF type:complete len:186 (+),score=62.13 TRINITY_DN1503_c0_g1_i3:179-736(+)